MTHHSTHSVASEMYTSDAYVSPGMPPLEDSRAATSFFEFWPIWVIYLPVVFNWLFLSLRHCSLSLPLIANPRIPNSGMVGYSKNDFLAQGNSQTQRYILPWVTHTITDAPIDEQVDLILSELEQSNLKLPIVGKPDMGCRGAGVKLLDTRNDLETYLGHYSAGSQLVLQQLAEWEPEAGIFYVKHPDENVGRITSVALKYTPYVVGDGTKTLRELIRSDVRAGQIMHLYEDRHKALMENVIPEDKPFRLVFSASHCHGAIFTDGRKYITDALSQKIDHIMSGFPEFYYGRLDVKFKSIEQLKQGEDIAIIEINGASAESLHIWDKATRLKDAWKSLIWQYRTLFKIGAANRARGHKPPGITSLLSAWSHERSLAAHYPQTD